MGEPVFVTERGGDQVAADGESGGNTAVTGRKTRKDQQPAFVQRSTPLGGHSQFFNATRETYDDRRFSAQQDAEAFLFDGRMKTADDAPAGIAPVRGLIVGAENGIARAAS
jgi:hypothetical protein